MISAGRPIKKGFKEVERLFFLGSEENVLLTNMGRHSENRVRLTVPVILLLIGLLLQITISTAHANEGKTMSADHGKTSAHGGIILMRHGEAEHNVEDRFNSAPGHPAYAIKPLTSLGQEQARKSGDELLEKGISSESICRILVSPLPRTQETAGIVAEKLLVPDVKMQTIDELIESQIGEREGQKISDYNEPDPWFPENPERFGGETYAQVEQRVRSVLESVLNDSDCDLNNQYVLLVSHGVPLYVMLDLLTGNGEKISPASYRIIHNPSIINN